MDAAQEIKSRLSVEEVVGDYLQLKSAGRNLKAISPFTVEKTPSFMVSPEKQIWYCFSSNQGGDMFDFVMKMDGLDFKGALEVLGRKAGVDLSQFQQKGGDGKLKDRLYAMLELSTKYYQQSLVKNEKAVDYIKSREFNRETVIAFGFGYAPKTDTGLVDFLRKNKYKDEDILKAGIASKRDGQLKDLFRSRIVLPLKDTQGRVVGFVGRKLIDDGYGPKYLNSPQTILYDKSRFIFGLNTAKNSIREEDEVVLVEGNLDVVMSYQSGIKQVVAASGTALSIHQLKQLKRFTQNVKLAFDEDEAGLRATERAIELAQPLNLNLSIVSIPSGKDPDELIKQNAQLWTEAINEAPYVMDWLFSTLKSQFDISSASGKKKFSDRLLKTIGRLEDAVEREHYMNQLSEDIGISLSSLQAKLNTIQSPDKPTKDKKPKIDIDPIVLSEWDKLEEELLALCLIEPEARTNLAKLEEDYFAGAERRQLMVALRQIEGSISEKNLPEDLQPLESYVKILLLKGEEKYNDWNSGDRAIEAMNLSKRMRALDKENTKKQISVQIREAENSGDRTLATELLKRYQDLVKE